MRPFADLSDARTEYPRRSAELGRRRKDVGIHPFGEEFGGGINREASLLLDQVPGWNIEDRMAEIAAIRAERGDFRAITCRPLCAVRPSIVGSQVCVHRLVGIVMGVLRSTIDRRPMVSVRLREYDMGERRSCRE